MKQKDIPLIDEQTREGCRLIIKAIEILYDKQTANTIEESYSEFLAGKDFWNFIHKAEKLLAPTEEVTKNA